ncbi:MAG TPA: HDIG domain-containing protein [Solirubrobacteraceae bacterium]|jgi:putative nucleotidyltransferase with HDIG domain|nr:HDIG domain-containing protein [Solirubrobacteraceae bacterium]
MSAGLQAAREALAGSPAWLVGGAVRDELLGREVADYDVVVAGDPATAARAVAKAGPPAACFALSEEFGSWRVVARDSSWQVDVEPLRAATLEEDLTLRDFTVNAIARPLAGGETVDPLGGAEDLRAGRLRIAGPGSFEQDPLRVLRLVRVAVELGLAPDEPTLQAARDSARGLTSVSGERIFVELRRTIATPSARPGIELLADIGALGVVVPELEALRGVEQSTFHHADVYDHTLEVLDRTVELTGPDGPQCSAAAIAIEAHRPEIVSLLAEPLADEMSRGEAMRWGALLHDAAKPLTREVRAGDGRVTFIGHDSVGAELAREVLGRLRASERLKAHVAGLVRHHLRLGFLVHDPQPLARRTVYEYLRACGPVGVDVSLLSVADRLATRGTGSERAIEAHLRLAGSLLTDALVWRRTGPPAPPLRGDELASELGISPGPVLGDLLGEISAASYAGEISDRAAAIARARLALAARRQAPMASPRGSAPG